MGVWSTTTPAGSDLLSQGDDKIREMKLAIQEALRAGEVAGDNIEGVEAIFPGASPSTAPVYRYRGLRGTTAERPTAGQYGLYFDTTRSVLQRDNGTSWEDIGQVVLDGSITEAKLSASVAGAGLSGGANTPLSVNVGDGLEISSDNVKLATGIDGSGLTLTGSVLSLNVDNSTVEVSSDTLRVKAGGIGVSHIASGIIGGDLFKVTIVNLGSRGLGWGESYNYTVNNAYILGVKTTVSGMQAWETSASISFSNTGNTSSGANGSMNTGQIAGTVTISYGGNSSTPTFSNVTAYYIQLPTISYA